jgi:choline dehydrogenase
MHGDRKAFDALVLGGGTAGCVVAARLSEDEQCNVCLVEAGPDYGPHSEGRWPDDMLDALDVPDSHDWRDRQGCLRVAKIIGGCSAHNFCALAIAGAADYDSWGLTGWSWSELEPRLKRVLETLPVRFFTDDQLNPWFAALVEAAAEIGLPVHEDLNSPDATEGIGRLPFNVRGTTRWNAAFAYLDPVRRRPNLELQPDTRAVRIELEGERVVSVVVRTPERERNLRARVVVLTAGAYGSPALLLRSGIGPEEELRRHGIPVRAVLPVGTRLREHFGVPLRFAASERMAKLVEGFSKEQPVFPCNGMVKARSVACPPGLWNLFLLTALFPGPVLSSSVMLMRPQWSGSVRLRSADPDDLPLVSELTLDSDSDGKAVFEGLALGRRLARAKALTDLVGEELTPGPDITLTELRRRGREGLTTFFHPVGTCPMGERGTTELDGRLRGLDNLYLADASILPEIPPAPTNVTVLAAAEKIALGIRTKLGG